MPWLIIDNKEGTGCDSMRRSSKYSEVHALTGDHRRRHAAWLTGNTSNPNSQFPVFSSEQQPDH